MIFLRRLAWVWAVTSTAVMLGGAAVAAEEPPCAGADLQLANRAAVDAKRMLDTAIAAIDKPTASDLDRLRIWLGVVNSSDAQKVKQVLVNARVYTNGASYRCAVTTNIAIGDVYAYVRADNSFAIVLGSFFLQASDTGFNSRPGVLIHEMSHFILAGATKDKVYGVEGARQLAAQNPSSAQKNADNFEYFVEAITFGLK